MTLTLDQALDRAGAEIDGIIADALADAADLLRRLGGTDAEIEAEIDRQRAGMADWRAEKIAELRRELTAWLHGSTAALH